MRVWVGLCYLFDAYKQNTGNTHTAYNTTQKKDQIYTRIMRKRATGFNEVISTLLSRSSRVISPQGLCSARLTAALVARAGLFRRRQARP